MSSQDYQHIRYEQNSALCCKIGGGCKLWALSAGHNTCPQYKGCAAANSSEVSKNITEQCSTDSMDVPGRW